MVGFNTNKKVKKKSVVHKTSTTSEVPVTSDVTPSSTADTKIVDFLETTILQYTDFQRDYALLPWIMENIDDPDVEPLVESTATAKILSFKDSIARVKSTVLNREIPTDFVDSPVTKVTNTPQVEVKIL